LGGGPDFFSSVSPYFSSSPFLGGKLNKKGDVRMRILQSNKVPTTIPLGEYFTLQGLSIYFFQNFDFDQLLF